MTQRKAEILMASIIATRAMALMFTKIALLELTTFNLIFMRFLTGFVLLGLLFFKRLRRVKWPTLWRGIVLGTLFFAIVALEVTAAHTATAAAISVLVNTAIIMVPLMNAVLQHRAPKGKDLLCAGVAVIGIVLLNWTGEGLQFHIGELLSMMEAVLYAMAIILTDRFSHHEKDTVAMGIIQIGTLGVLALLTSLVIEQPHLPQQPATWGAILTLGIVCTGFGFTFQPVAQRYISAETAGSMCVINPVVATASGVLLLREPITTLDLLGIALIAGSLLLPYLGKEKKPMKYKTFLFDMDGTTMNTLDDLRDAVNRTLRLHGYPERTPQQIRDATGNGARDLIAQNLPQGTDTPDFDAVLKDYRAWYEAHSCVRTAPYPGTVETLRELQKRGAKVAVISNKNDPAVRALGEKFFPDIPVLGEVPPVPRKPAPDMINTMLERLGVTGDDAVYVGDSEVDIATARNSRMDFIGVSWGFRGREKLLELAPDVTVVDSWEEFLEIVG